MNSIINLLPDHVANQIAAGEVIQRPASVVKELLENAIDSGATSIELHVEDAGKTLIRVIDNGCGMNEQDAQMCFERHATSKICEADDIFLLNTKGFRGEALASIAAIAHVDLKTKQSTEDLGTHIKIEGSEIKTNEPCATADGTSFEIKNLFYNVPARRKFLKSNAVESKHIVEEFVRVALAHPDIQFKFFNNDHEVYHLKSEGLRQRIVALFGKNYNERLVPIEEETNIVKMSGFIGKPAYAKKTRGEQYFFVNHRFIKNNYLQHAITQAFQEVLINDTYPSFFIFLEVDPRTIDINIHPTKTEIKFEEEKSIYAILRSSVRKALSEHAVTPSIDFDVEESFDDFNYDPNREVVEPKIKVDTSYNPFNTQPKASKPSTGSSYTYQSPALNQGRGQKDDWKTFFEELSENTLPEEEDKELFEEKETHHSLNFFQLEGGFIITHIKSGLCIIDQRHAHERVLYDNFLNVIRQNRSETQQLLFPESIDVNPGDMALIKGLIEDINQLGFDIREFGANSIAMYGVPAQIRSEDGLSVIEELLEYIKSNPSDFELEANQKIALKLSQYAAIKRNQKMTSEEMENLIAQLFSTSNPNTTPSGKPIIINHTISELKKQFKH